MSSTTAALQVTDFVRALALAWKNIAAYPPGHPALVASLDRVDQALRELRGPAGDVTFGIASDGIFYGDLKIDALAAQKFAHALFMRGVAVLRFSGETSTSDIDAFLRVLATRGDATAAFGDTLTARGVININAQSVHYDSVQVTDTLDGDKAEPQRSVWEDILKALMENRQFARGVREVPRITATDELSRLLSDYADAADDAMTFDPNATFGVRLASLDGTDHPLYRFLELTVGKQIAEATGPRKQHSIEQAVQLIRTLPHTLRRSIVRAVIRALSDDLSGTAMLRHFASELPSDEVLDALRYLSAAGPLSQHAMSLLETLTTIEASARAETPSHEVVADVVKLFGDEDLNRFNPTEYGGILSTAALRIPDVPEEAVTSLERLGLRYEAIAETMPEFTRVLFDLLYDKTLPAEAILKRLESVFRAHLTATRYADALALAQNLLDLAKTSEGTRKNEIEDSMARLATGDAIRDLIESVHRAPPEAARQIQDLARALGVTAQRNLLIALAEETNRSRRRRLFDFLTSFGSRIAPDVVPLLGDDRWYVVRNMIALLRAIGDRTALEHIRPLTQHHDLRVRLEAIRTMFALDPRVARTTLDNVLEDPDNKVAEAAIGLVGTYAVKEAVEPLLRILEGNDVFGAKRMLRIKALRALGDIGDETALPQLDRFLKTSFLPWPARDERYAAWESLRRYPSEATRPIVERGKRSADPQVRAICERIPVK